MQAKKFGRLLVIINRIYALNKEITMKTKRVLSALVLASFCLTFFGPTAGAQVCSFPPSGLVAWYKGEGNVNDSSGNGNHGISHQGDFQPGQVGQAFNFNAQNLSTVLPNNPSMFPPTALTVEAWINPTTYSGCGTAYRIFHTVQVPVTGYATFTNCDGTLIGAIFDSAGVGNFVFSNTLIPAGTFTHFAVTWDGSNLRTYINGALDNVAATTILAIGTNTETPRLGSTPVFGFVGRIDEASLYNRALSDAEVAAIFNAGTAGKCLAPTAGDASISGRVVTSTGRGLADVLVTVVDENGNPAGSATTNSFGFFTVGELPTASSYVINAQRKRFRFDPMSHVITLEQDMTGVNFIATPALR
jgi:hypothetical protein